MEVCTISVVKSAIKIAELAYIGGIGGYKGDGFYVVKTEGGNDNFISLSWAKVHNDVKSQSGGEEVKTVCPSAPNRVSSPPPPTRLSLPSSPINKSLPLPPVR